MTIQNTSILSDLIRESIDKGSIPTLTVISNSMAPLLQAGDEIGLRKVDLNLLTSCSLITFELQDLPGDLMTHRVATKYADKEGAIVATMSDRYLIIDKPIRSDQIVGQVIWRIRNGRKFSMDDSWGAWLNQKLCSLANKEFMVITGYSPENIAQFESVAETNELMTEKLSSFRFRQWKRMGRIWAILLSYFAEIMNLLSGASQEGYAG